MLFGANSARTRLSNVSVVSMGPLCGPTKSPSIADFYADPLRKPYTSAPTCGFSVLGHRAPVRAAGLCVTLADQPQRGVLAPRLGQRPGEDLGGLGAGDAVLAVEDEEGHPVRAELGGL